MARSPGPPCGTSSCYSPAAPFCLDPKSRRGAESLTRACALLEPPFSSGWSCFLGARLDFLAGRSARGIASLRSFLSATSTRDRRSASGRVGSSELPSTVSSGPHFAGYPVAESLPPPPPPAPPTQSPIRSRTPGGVRRIPAPVSHLAIRPRRHRRVTGPTGRKVTALPLTTRSPTLTTTVSPRGSAA